MTYANRIIKAFGGIRPMARKTGHPVSTVQSWGVKGEIPDRHKAAIWEAAMADEGIDLMPEDFLPFEPEKQRAAT